MTNPTQNLEAAIVAAGATKAPRITPADIEANIDSEHYFTASQGTAGAAYVIHASNIVRGLLCHACNVMLGAARDKPEILKLGAEYLDRCIVR